MSRSPLRAPQMTKPPDPALALMLARTSTVQLPLPFSHGVESLSCWIQPLVAVRVEMTLLPLSVKLSSVAPPAATQPLAALVPSKMSLPLYWLAKPLESSVVRAAWADSAETARPLTMRRRILVFMGFVLQFGQSLLGSSL